jgi:hypothetical protein
VTRVVVEAAFGQALPTASTWTDITNYVDMATGLSISRGASDELSQAQPGTLTVRLDNSDGRFTPGRASSPYYPNVKRNTPIRVRLLSTAKNYVTNPSFETNAAGWTSPSADSTRTSLRAQDGTFSYEAHWPDTSAGPGAEITVFGLDVGVTYTASAWVWVNAGSNPVRLAVAGLATGGASTLTGAWQQITYTFTATSTSHRLQLYCTTPAVSQLAWLDTVQVEAGATASSFSADVQMIGRFVGVVGEWPTSWDGLYSTVTVTCTDTFKWVARRTDTLPMLGEEILADGAVAYYPLTELGDSLTAGDVSGTTAAALTITQVSSGGTLVFAGGSGPAATGQAAPLFTPASASAGKYLTGNLGSTVESGTTVAAGFYALLYVECWFSTATTGRVILGLSSTDQTNQLVFSLDGSGALQVESTTSGSLSPSSVATGNLANSAIHHLLYDHASQTVWVDGASYPVFSTTVSALRTLSVGGFASARLWSGSISHVAVYAIPGGSSNPAADTAHYTAGTTGCAGETTSARISRLASYAGITAVTTQGSPFSLIASQGELGSSLLEHLQDVELCESGHLIASRDQAGLIFQSRALRYNPTPSLSLDYADLEPGSVELSDDDQKMVNTVTASRPGGATQRVVNKTSRTANGPYEKTLDLLKTTDTETLDAANWTVSRYADPAPEIRDFTVEAYSLGLTAYRALLAADVSSVVTITGLPTEAPASTATVAVEGYTETIKHRQHVLAFHVSAAQTDTVWVLDSGAYSVLGSTTRLAY